MSNNTRLDELLDEVLDLLDEAKTPSRTVITRTTKIRRATGQLASIEARKRNDPLYQRMKKYRDLYFKYKQLVHNKYGPRVRSKARN